jgi:ligand-binding sensor domain-containing protein
VRFDGVRFTVFDTTNSTLTDNSISNLLAGRDGSLWIRTAEHLYRHRAGHIQTVCSGRSIGLDTTPMLEDRSGAIWSRDAGGVMVYPTTGACRHHAIDESGFAAEVTSIVETSDGTILLGTAQGLKQFDQGRVAEPRGLGVPAMAVTAMLVDRGGSLWIGGTGVLLCRSSGGLTRFGAAEAWPRPSSGDPAGQGRQHLVRHRRGGIGRIHGGRVETMTAATGLPEDRVRSMYEDREGGLWMGTVESGAVRFRDGSATTFGRHQGLAGDVVRALLQDRSGRFFVGLEGHGVAVRAPDGTFTTDRALEPLRTASIRPSTTTAPTAC